MASNGEWSKILPSEVGESYYVEERRVSMDPIAAKAWETATYNQHAIPAQEKTKQEGHITNRHYASTILLGIVILAVLGLIATGHEIEMKYVAAILIAVVVTQFREEVAKALAGLGSKLPTVK